MSAIIRVLILVACAAAGIGLAVSVANHADSESPAPDGSQFFLPADAAPRTSAADSTGSQGPHQLAELTPPATADWHPVVAAQSKGIEQMLEWLKEAGEQQKSALDAAREIIHNHQTGQGATTNQAAPSSFPAAAGNQDPAAVDNSATLPAPATSTRNEIVHEGDDRLRINLRQADIREVLETFSEQTDLNILTAPNVAGTVTASLRGVSAREALVVVLRNAGLEMKQEGDFYFVGSPQDIQQMLRFNQPVLTRVYRPNYVSATELQKLVAPLLTQGVGEATVSTAQSVVSTPPQKGIAASADQSGGDDFAGNEVLIIRDYESVLQYVDQLVNEVDQRPRQVALETMILSVRLDDANSMGVNFEFLRNKTNTRMISATPLTDLASIDLTEGGLKVGFLDTSISAFVQALETVGDTNVIAAPRLMCLNKQRAEILIGSQLGYVSTTITETSATQSVEFLEVGTQLRFRPYIASDGMIRLEVHPELSTGNVRIEQGFTLPDKDVTQVTTNVMCHDGATVIIGGLIREDLTGNRTQIPILGNLPIAGALFRDRRETIERREIIVVLTPHIVHEPVAALEGSRMQAAYLQRQENYADKMSVIGKRHYGLHYLRLARAAWNAQDPWTALRFINLSIHFDPMNREAHDLHGEIVSVLPPEADTIGNHLRLGLAPGKKPNIDYSKSGHDWKSVTPPPEFVPEHDSWPGEPAPRLDLQPQANP
jgi:type IV pilus assembly protein PilQ